MMYPLQHVMDVLGPQDSDSMCLEIEPSRHICIIYIQISYNNEYMFIS